MQVKWAHEEQVEYKTEIAGGQISATSKKSNCERRVSAELENRQPHSSVYASGTPFQGELYEGEGQRIVLSAILKWRKKQEHQGVAC